MMDGACITVNGILHPLPPEATLEAVIDAYSPYATGEPLLIRLNGSIINSLLEDCGVKVKDGDRIDIFPLVLGG